MLCRSHYGHQRMEAVLVNVIALMLLWEHSHPASVITLKTLYARSLSAISHPTDATLLFGIFVMTTIPEFATRVLVLDVWSLSVFM